MKTEIIKQKREIAQERLNLYYEKERDILSGGVQAYGIGNRSLTRYNADLSNVRSEIDKLEKVIAEYDALLDGRGRRRAVRIIPQDW